MVIRVQKRKNGCQDQTSIHASTQGCARSENTCLYASYLSRHHNTEPTEQVHSFCRFSVLVWCKHYSKNAGQCCGCYHSPGANLLSFSLFWKVLSRSKIWFVDLHSLLRSKAKGNKKTIKTLCASSAHPLTLASEDNIGRCILELF